MSVHEMREMDTTHLELGDVVNVYWSEGRHAWCIVKGDSIIGDAISVLLYGMTVDRSTGALWLVGTLAGWAVHPMGRSCYEPVFHAPRYVSELASHTPYMVAELLPSGKVAVFG